MNVELSCDGMKRQDDITMIESVNPANNDISGGSDRAAIPASTDFVVNQPKNPEWDCLLIACQKGDVSTARRILREHPSSMSHANFMGQSALHIAAWWNHVECVDLLLQSGADARAVNSFSGATPLHECLESNRVRRSKEQRRKRIECFSLLLQAETGVANVVDDLGRLPLECFVVADEEDDADYAEIEELVAANERAANNPVRKLLQKLNSKECTLGEIDRLWLEAVVRDLDLRSTYTLLSTELLSTTEAWIDRAEEEREACQQNSTDLIDNCHFLECGTWIWSKLVEIFDGIAIRSKEDDELTVDPPLASVLQTTLNTLGMALFNRYEHLYKTKKNTCNETPHLLQEDATLSSWNKLAVTLVRERHDIFTNAEGSSSSKEWTDLENLQQTWITIARRNYHELAQLWLDRLEISPIGVLNRQGMTALQFAARSGHFRMAEFFLSHPLLTKDKTALMNWIDHKDHRGHMALASANANQHEQIVELLRGYNSS